jgi:hypothetical protein
MIAFSCEGCGKAFEVDVELAGRKSRCKRCRTVMNIPAFVPAAPREVKRAFDWGVVVSLGLGLGLTMIAFAVPLIAMVAYCLATVIHELGHTATSWLFGSPSVPAFDLKYGGGFTRGLDRQPILVVAIYAVFGYFLLRAWPDKRKLIIWTVIILVYSVATATPLHRILILAMGHGAELLFSGIFLYRALTCSQVLRKEERPLYAFLGLLMLFINARSSFGLATSAEAREAYHEAHGGLGMDFDIIADDYLPCPLQAVAAGYLLACVLTPVATFFAYQHWKRLR